MYATNNYSDPRLTKHVTEAQQNLIAEAYAQTRGRIVAYITRRINDAVEAEDLTQDVFVRLLEYGATVSRATITSLIYTVARNITFDYLRHKYRSGEIENYLMETSSSIENSTESAIMVRDLEEHERRYAMRLPHQRSLIYTLSRFSDKKVADIAAENALSVRTVENHLRLARIQMRDSMARLMRI